MRRKGVGTGTKALEEDESAGGGPERAGALVATALGGAGHALDPASRAVFEARFRTGFGGVRVHTGARADESARAVGALAYTVGRDVVFRAGAYAPATPAGRRVLAHELAHVVQQRSSPAPSPAALADLDVGSAGHPAEREADAAADAVLAGRPAPSLTPESGEAPLRRGDPRDAEGGGTLGEPERDALAAEGIELEAEDERALAELYPHGFTLWQGETHLLATGATRAYGYRLAGVQVVQPAPLMPGVETWIFHVNKGRSILVSSRGGGSVMLDVGVDVRDEARGAARLVREVESLVGAGAVEAPRRVVFSHTDRDHMNAATAFLGSAIMARATVQIATEQLRGSVGAGDWARMGITLQPTQNLVELQVTGGTSGGGGVHVHRIVIGNMEMTEFRSVAAHAALAGGARSEKNRTSPVTVVTDLVTGERMIFTADAVGRQFNEIINSIGEDAFRRIIGAEGRNLRLVEYPHHGGAVSGSAPRTGGGSDVSGMVRFLRLAFEASGGSVRFFTQTSESFAGGASASTRILGSTGVDVHPVLGEGASPAGSTATRAAGGTLSEVSFDAQALRSIVEVARARETEVMRAYRHLHECRTLQERAAAMSRGFSMAGMPAEMVSSVEQTRSDARAAEQGVRDVLERFWAEMETAGRGRLGLRAGRDLTRVNAELTALERVLAGVDLRPQRDALAAHEANLSAYARLFTTAAEMREALRAQRYQDLHALRARLSAEIRAARGLVGGADMAAHVRAAWARMSEHFSPERVRQLTARTGFLERQARVRSTVFRLHLAESLGTQIVRQQRLNALAEAAAHGNVAGGGPVSGGRRAGAGFLLLLEVVRLGLEMAEQAHAASTAADARAARNRTVGTGTVLWWVDHGAEPTMALVARNWWSGYDTVSDGMSQEGVRAAITGETAEGVPEHEMVVVERVSTDDLLFLVHSLYLELHSLEDWLAFNNGYPQGPLFRKFGDDWGVLLWSREESRYLYHLRDALREPLDQLHRHLEIGQEEVLEERARAAGDQGLSSLRDTGWVSNERLAYVYGRSGHLREIDFDDARPRFVRLGRRTVGRDEFELVQAADLATWRVLSGHYWRRDTGTWIGAGGSGGVTFDVFSNREGLAFVDPDTLVRAP